MRLDVFKPPISYGRLELDLLSRRVYVGRWFDVCWCVGQGAETEAAVPDGGEAVEE